MSMKALLLQMLVIKLNNETNELCTYFMWNHFVKYIMLFLQ